MTARSRAGLALALWVVPATAWAVSPPTIYDNAQPFPLGSRAAALAGAYTALACDEAAVHYNPAALACAAASRLELAANAYVLQALEVRDAFGKGEDISALTYHSVPAIVGGARVWLEGEPDTRVGRLVSGISVTIPQSIAIQVEPSRPSQPSAITYAGRDALIAGELGVGYQLTPSFALGLALGGVVRTYEAHTNGLVADDENPSACGPGGTADCVDFYAFARESNILAVGARAKLGLRYTPEGPGGPWSFGFTLSTPTLDVYGSARTSSTMTYGLHVPDPEGTPTVVYGQYVSRVQGGSDAGLPLRLAAGAAYSTPAFTLSADVSLMFPHEVYVARDVRPVEIRNTPSDEIEPNAVLHRDLLPNVNVGFEVALAEKLVLNLGFYTDLSAVSEQDWTSGDSDRVPGFGGTVALGLLGTQTRTWLGLAGSYGRHDTYVPSGARTVQAVVFTGLPEDTLAPLTRWTVVGFLGSSYSFLPE